MVLETAADTTEEIGGFTVAGVAQRDTNIDESALWGDLDEYRDDLADVAVGDDYYGVLFDLDEDSGEFTYVAGVEVDSADELPAEMTAVELPEATYAVFRPTADTVEEVVASMDDEEYGDDDHAPGPMFERYDPDADPHSPAAPREFYVPVAED